MTLFLRILAIFFATVAAAFVLVRRDSTDRAERLGSGVMAAFFVALALIALVLS